ncbi:ABC transporter ATP-binding protein [Flavobacterium magnum]|uniref:ABC transporter ATP-binding protein n=1 Tax=Flavobacterium magnum TaxID=2162713 RepID=A0A2S0RI80_9FLAO|nr:ATP-binding cassette domain-containing protein [Flavobacterium magnum]AWA30432.1 ABC transporter ATP-binding protein [Flavobacterium magnum]
MKENTTPTENVIEVRNLYKGFGGMQVLNDLSFELRRGENLVILGKSGTGKSVTIKCIVRLLTADSGSINVMGQDVNQLKEKELDGIRQKIGFLFQSGALYDSMTVRQNLEFPLRRIKKDLSEADIEAKVKEVLENVGLPEAIDKMPSELSGGMRKRISLARTIIVDPQIMLYDEPTTGLDPVTSHEISLLINEIQHKYKTSSIVITHDIECARTTANRMIMLKEGKVYKEGKPQEFENTDDELINSYFQSQNIKNLKTT